MAHQARPTTTIITNTRQNHTYHVIAAPKLRPGTAVPSRPTKITVQKMIWFGRIRRNWNLRLRTTRATRGCAVSSAPGRGSVGAKRSASPARSGPRRWTAVGSGSRNGAISSCTIAAIRASGSTTGLRSVVPVPYVHFTQPLDMTSSG